MKLQDLDKNMDESAFLKIIFNNEISKYRFFEVLKEYIQNQDKYDGIKDFLAQKKFPNMQFLEECQSMGLVVKKGDKIELSFDILNKLEQAKTMWKDFVSSIQ